MRILMIIVAAAPLMGCEIAAFAPKADESSDYPASTDRYLACIIANSSDPQQCEVARVLMEADGRRYYNTLPGTVTGAVTGSVSPAVQSSMGVTARLGRALVRPESVKSGLWGLVPSAFGALLRPQRNKGDECPDDADRIDFGTPPKNYKGTNVPIAKKLITKRT
jgi:hypothetical protein